MTEIVQAYSEGWGLAEADPAVAELAARERQRQELSLDLIASENIAPQAVLAAVGSAFNNKTAEGYPGRRYHTGCEVADELEALAMARAKALFGAEHANVQPHSGVNANLAVYAAVLTPGDRVLSMKLSHGGHLSHGDPASITGRVYQFHHYGVDPASEKLDYDQIRDLARQQRPRLIVAGGSSYPRLIEYATLRGIADEVSALLLVDMAHIAGLVAARVHPDPVPYADVVTTTTHKTLRGPRGGMILSTEEFASAINKAVFPGSQGGPLEHVIAGKAVALKEALQPSFVEYQQQVLANARALGAQLQARGLRLVSGGTDNHLLLVDLTTHNVSGKQAADALHAVGITCNKNLIPFDTRTAVVTSGIRLGTPALTTRGMREAEMYQIGDWMADVITHIDDAALHARIHQAVQQLAARFPAPGIDM